MKKFYHLGEANPLARSSDPATSHEAAQHMRESGKLAKQQVAVRLRVVMDPGMTAREYQEMPGYSFPSFHRRLVEVERLGLVRRGAVRKCRVGGRLAATWWPVETRKAES